ncbi:MAG TPA: thiamine phosphate synthase [Polyangia bacterium]|nr:thiamine phosphate synthase [Polyangia bacterium]
MNSVQRLEWMRGYYAIVDVRPEGLGDLDAISTRATKLLAAGPCCLQLRAKGADAAAMVAAALRLRHLCRAARVPFCVNDRLDVALAVGADVVHLGQDDLPLADARRVRALAKAEGMVIGFSTHDRAQALAAAAGGADYLGFGPVFATGSKVNPDPVVGLEALAGVCAAVRIPIVAIGGIGLDAVSAVVRAGAAAAAVIGAVNGAADPTAAARAVAAAFA